MLYSETKNALIVTARNPDAMVLNVPNAVKSSQHDGVVYAPMNLDTCVALGDMGITPIMTPIERAYQWAGKHQPYDHQKRTAGFCVTHRRGYVLNSMGTGKTMSILWALDYLMQQGRIKKALIVSPLSTLEAVWANEIYFNFFNRTGTVLYGRRSKRKQLLEVDSDFYIINYDGLPSVIQELRNRKDIDALVIDEGASYRNSRTERWKLMKNYINDKNPEYVWLLTGTPTPNAPTDAWGQARLLGTHKGLSFTKFREMTMKKVSQFVWQPRYGSEKMAAALLFPSIRYRLEDCIDLPPTTYSNRKAELSSEQAKVYKLFMKSLHHEFEQGAITAVNAADKQNKLIQIACGFAYARGDDNQILTNRIDVSHRVAVVKEILEETDDGKTIVFVPYKELTKILSEEFPDAALVDGSVTKVQRDAIFNSFQNDNEPTILIAHPKTMAHGLTLTSATTIIWYAPYPSNEVYTQANARIARPSQTKHTRVIHISATSEEEKIYNRLKSKQALQGLLLDIVNDHKGS